MHKTPFTKKDNEHREKVKPRQISSTDKIIIKNFCLTEAGEKFFYKMYAEKDFEILFTWTLQVMGCYLDLQKWFEGQPREAGRLPEKGDGEKISGGDKKTLS